MNEPNSIQRARQLGQSIWLDYIRRGLIKSGELDKLIDEGISGLTANPTILEKAIVGSTDYDAELVRMSETGKSDNQIYEALAIQDIRSAADLLRPIYDRTLGADGYPCLEISPLLAYDTEGSVKEGKRLFADLDRPNVMVKVPATREGIPAIRRLVGEGIKVNVTLIFSLNMYDLVKEAYISGLEDFSKKGGDPARISSVASFFLSRIDTAVDNQLEALIKGGKTELRPLLGKAAVASAKVAYSRFRSTFYGERFSKMRARNAHVQRLLWASTSTKNHAYSDVMYVEPLIGKETVNTMPLETIRAFLDHGKAELTLEENVAEAVEVFKALESAGISMKAVTDKLLADGVKAFDDSFTKLISGIGEKKSRLISPVAAGHDSGLGEHKAGVEAAIGGLMKGDIAGRIWRKDYTVWSTAPTEIADRLGWLTVTDVMRERVSMLRSFADEVKAEGFRHAVLLGMGGSSLGAEVLRQVFGSASGFPQLIVLDSTVPAAIKAVGDEVDPAQTLFIVSSKSGTTTEPTILYKHFRQAVSLAGKAEPGGSFIAITDPSTPLARMGTEEGFRAVFLNPPDIGGRYSVLSYFGLVPGALIGADIMALLDRADTMRDACASCVPGYDNQGLKLGATLGALALKGRDKLTLVTSPSLGSFGLWVEQLIAESTGKDGKGIIPIAGEPMLSPEFYGADRMFAYMRLRSDDNGFTDAAIKALETSGQPVILIEMQDRLDLGAEFFRWEFATAVAGSVIGIHPFNQPDVGRAKDATERLLKDYVRSGKLPDIRETGSPADLLKKASPGKYLSVMAYIRETPETDAIFAKMRARIMHRYRIATSVGYGPRFLHSTGQLHKGGPNSGMFIQITAAHGAELPLPGEPYGFGVVVDAQALGDLQALSALGRDVVATRLERGDAETLARTIDEIPG